MKYLLLSAAILFVSCESQKPLPPVHPAKPEPVKPIEEEEKPIVVTPYSFKWKNKEYDKHLVDALKASKLLTAKPKDAEEFNYSKAPDALTFWGKLMVELAYWESKYNSDAYYEEKTCKRVFGIKRCSIIRDAKGNIVTSRGLFMLSRESGNGYGCGFTSEQDVHDAKKNIYCAVKIMERWVLRDKVIHTTSSPYLGGARYWAVLRANRQYTVDSLKAIKKANF